MEFFRFYALQFDAKRLAVSVRCGRAIPRGSSPAGRGTSGDRWLCVEDPFETSHNVCRSVSARTAPLVAHEFLRAFHVLTNTSSVEALCTPVDVEPPPTAIKEAVLQQQQPRQQQRQHHHKQQQQQQRSNEDDDWETELVEKEQIVQVEEWTLSKGSKEELAKSEAEDDEEEAEEAPVRYQRHNRHGVLMRRPKFERTVRL